MTPLLNPRRILMTADAVGGVWTYAFELCRALGTHGVEVVLATMGPPPRAGQRAEVEKLGNVTLCESEFRLEWMKEPWADVERAASWLLELEETFRPDVVHLNGFVHATAAWRAPVLVAGHSCVCSWWAACRGGEPPSAWSRYRALVAAGLRSAGAVVAPTRAMLAALEFHYARDGAGHGGHFVTTAVIPNGRRANGYTPATPKHNFILSVGRLWDEAKNAQALADVAPKLDWPVRMAGDMRAPDGTDRVLRNVQPLGCCEAATLAWHYARAGIYASPARYEPFGLSALEAALSGCALVLGDIPSLREVWEDGALFVAPDDRDALCAALNGLIREPQRRRRLALRALARAREFTVERMVVNYLAVYRRLLGWQPRPPLPGAIESRPVSA